MIKRQRSTTSAARRAKIQAARRGQQLSPGEARSIVIRPSHHRAPVTVTLQFMPGREPWVRITRDGASIVRPASILVWELILELHGWELGGR